MLRRYVLACVAALLVTTALLLVMTQLILPGGGDPVVTRMVLEWESRRSSPPEAESGVRVFERLLERETQDTPDKPEVESGLPGRPERAEYAAESNEEPIEAAQQQSTDWWAEVRAVIEDLGDKEYGNWLGSHGRRKYVSIMQGPMPGSGDPKTPSSQGRAGAGYTSVYGDLELAIGENCVMQMRSRPFDYSDFANNIPPLIVCKRAPETDFSGLDTQRRRPGRPERQRR